MDLGFRANLTWSEQAAGALRNFGRTSSNHKGEEKRKGQDRSKNKNKGAKSRPACNPNRTKRSDSFAPPAEEVGGETEH